MKSLVSGRACLMEIGYKYIWWARCNYVCEKFGLWELVKLLWLRNISKEGMKHDRIHEYGRRRWRNCFGMNERQPYLQVKGQPKNDKYANGSLYMLQYSVLEKGCEC